MEESGMQPEKQWGHDAPRYDWEVWCRCKGEHSQGIWKSPAWTGTPPMGGVKGKRKEKARVGNQEPRGQETHGNQMIEITQEREPGEREAEAQPLRGRSFRCGWGQGEMWWEEPQDKWDLSQRWPLNPVNSVLSRSRNCSLDCRDLRISFISQN